MGANRGARSHADAAPSGLASLLVVLSRALSSHACVF